MLQSKEIQDGIRKYPINIVWKTACPQYPNTNVILESLFRILKEIFKNIFRHWVMTEQKVGTLVEL